MSEIHHISKATYDRLFEEHRDLTTRGRVEIAEIIETARLMGDLKENGDYHAAKEEQGKMEGRIAHLWSVLEDCVITESGEGDSIVPGTVVEIRYEGDTDTEKMLYGSIEEKNGDIDVVSPGSPLGQAIKGHKAGDTATFKAPNGVPLTVEIVSIEG
ncbi:MAG: transcription elongation factor GreA [Candidatus Poriferisodalaceae bacterium]|jgi:transcription elongation factor GreA